MIWFGIVTQRPRRFKASQAHGKKGVDSNANWQNGDSGDFKSPDNNDANQSFVDGDTVTFSAPTGGSAVIDLDDDVAPSAITFEDDGYTITNTDGDGDRIIVDDGDTLSIDVTAGTATIEARVSNKGTVIINGAVGSTGTLDLSATNTDEGVDDPGIFQLEGGELIVSGRIQADDTVAVNGGTLTLTGDIRGAIQVDGGSFDNEIGGVASGLATVDGGDIFGNGGTFVGGVRVDSGQFTVTADTTANAGVTNDGGTVTINDGTALIATLENEAGTTNNNGTVNRDVSVTGGSFNNGDPGGVPTGIINGDVLVNGGTLNNNGDPDGTPSDITGAVQIGTDDGTNAGGTVEANGGTFAEIDIFDGDLNVNEDTAADAVSNDGGQVSVAGGFTLTTDFSQSAGTTTVGAGAVIDDSDDLIEVTGGVFENGGDIADDVTVSGTGALNNNAGGSLDGEVTISGADGTVVANGGGFGGALVVEGGTFDVATSIVVPDVTINSGAIDIAAGQTLEADLVHAGGVTTLNAGSQLIESDGQLDVTGGTIENGGTLADAMTISGSGAVSNNAGGSIAQTPTVNAGGTLIANGGAFAGNVIVSGGTFDVAVTSAITQTDVSDGAVNVASGATFTTDLQQSGGVVTVLSGGTLDSTSGTIVVDAGRLVNEGDILDQVTVLDGGAVEIGGGTFAAGLNATGGDIDVTADSTLDIENDGSVVTINQGITLTGNVVNQDGTTVSAGNITGTVDVNGGTFRQLDTTDPGDGVGGLVTVDGAASRLVALGGTFGSGITAQNDGVVRFRGGTATADVNNVGGRVTVEDDGALDGDITNADGRTLIQAGGQLDGDLLLSGGIAESDGTITGAGADANAVVITGGSLTTTENSDIQGTVAVEGGTLEAEGGAFGGDGIVATAGETIIAGDVAVEVSTDLTADFEVSDGGVLTGDVTVEGDSTGELENDGTIGGSVFANGGTFQNNGQIDGDGNANSVEVAGGVFSHNAGGSIGSTVRVESGEFVANGGAVTGDITVVDGDGGGAGTSTLTVAAVSAADVVNGTTGGGAEVGGAVVINSDQTLTGALTNNSGSAQIAGLLDGALAVLDGTVTASAGSDGVSGATDVSGGTLDLFSGTFGEITASGGTTTVDGAITISAGDELVGADGSVVITADGVVTGDVASESGGGVANTLQNDGQIGGDARVAGNTLENNGAIIGEVTVTGGTIENTGAVQNGLSISDGVANNSGQIAEGATITGDGVMNLQAGGTITGASTVGGDGLFAVQGGTFADGVTNNGGTIDVLADAAGAISNAAGTTTVQAGATLTGDVENAATGTDGLDLLGTVAGDVSNSGAFDAAGTVTGTTENSGSDAVISVATAATFGGLLTNEDSGTIDLDGTLTGSVLNQSGGMVDLDGGSITGAFDNAATAVVDGASSIGNLTNRADLTINSGGVLTAGSFLNTSDGTVTLQGELIGDVTNNGDIRVTNGAGNDGLFSGDVTNNSSESIYLVQTATPQVDEVLRFGGSLLNNGRVDTSTFSENIGDTVAIAGDLSGVSRFRLDINLSDETDVDAGETGADAVTVAGDISGNVLLDFNLQGVDGLSDPIRVVDANFGLAEADFSANIFETTQIGLPDQGGAIIYTLNQIESGADAGDVFVVSQVNPGISSLAGSVVLTQSLIGSVINRPSSPFVSGLAYDDPDPCGPGTWARAIGGSAETSGAVTDANSPVRDFQSEISVDYAGFQLGGDLACFGGYFDGWDVSFGAIGGFNAGTTEQPVFALVGDGTNAGGLVQSDTRTSLTTVEFDQAYGGVYVTGAYDRLSIDLQYRFEQTDFVADNEGVNGSVGLALSDSEFSSSAETFSGSVSYALPLGESSFVFVPTAGFAYTKVETEDVVFDDDSVVSVNDFTSEILFAGGTLARTSFAEDGTSALSQFVTATYYNDIADDPTSVFTPRPELDGDSQSLTNENLGAYGELSLGLNYLRILPLDAPLGAKQLSASLRGDLRSSDQLDSWGITGQFRIQF